MTQLLPFYAPETVFAAGATPGSLDAAFDTDGLVSTDIGGFGDEGRVVAVQPDGKILVGGSSDNGASSDFMLVRYMSDGSLDTGFDSDGSTTTDFNGQEDYGTGMAVQVDGKIVLVGRSEFNMGSESELALVRYNPDGSLDTSFDMDGKVTTNLGNTYEGLGAVAIQTDGKIVVVGSRNIDINDDDLVVLRYNPDGTLDGSFDTDGVVNTALGNTFEWAGSVVLQPDGKILVGGSFYNGSNLDLILLRYTSTGSLDLGFAGDGIVTWNSGVGSSADSGGQIALQADGRIVLGGYNNISGYVLLARYNANGTPDLSFDGDGFVTTAFGLQVQDLVLQPNGKIVVAGHTLGGGISQYDFALARYSSNGVLDTSFDGDGKVTTDFGSNQADFGNAVVLQKDGNILVAGYTNYADVAVARYVGDALQRWTPSFDLVHGWTVQDFVRTVGDVTGDGAADLVGFGADGVYVGAATGTGFVPAVRWTQSFDLGHGWTVKDFVRIVGDVTGDSRADVVGFGADGVYVGVSTGTDFQTAVKWTSSFDLSHGWTVADFVRTVGDVTGDGKADIVGFGADGVYVGVSNGAGFDTAVRWTQSFDLGHGWTVKDFVRTVGDVTGDGKADIVGFGADGVYVGVSNGAGFDAAVRWTQSFDLGHGWTVKDFVRTVGDVTGDGKADIVGFGLDGVYVGVSTGTAFQAAARWTQSFDLSHGWTVKDFVRTVGDINGDGTADLVGFGLDGVYIALAQ